jgi:thiol-disulfide isomerase/thioredoxin
MFWRKPVGRILEGRLANDGIPWMAMRARLLRIASGVPGALAILLVVGCASVQPAGNVSESSVPDFEITLFANSDNEGGEILKLSDLEGRPTVVNFWFPSCPPCVAEMPDIESVYQKHKENVEFVGIQLVGLDSVADGQDFVTDGFCMVNGSWKACKGVKDTEVVSEKINPSYSIGADEDAEITFAYGVQGFPTTIFLDKDHNMVRRWVGALTREKLEELVVEIQG